ncbi:MAG: M20/M25/M40 family metallo-hydrolase [Myxococcaceae bacterium]|nr:M20/M25/M40 family metallo-hydrolase [Myxococcaceae bacterium]
MRSRHLRSSALLVLFAAACATTPESKPEETNKAPLAKLLPEEKHLKELKQLTFGGENAEAYWSFDGQRLSFQAHGAGEACDRIYTMRVFDDPVTPKPVSTGLGATTCAHFFPEDTNLLYASTHLGGAECPAKPDMSQGYVWALYDTYDIFKAQADGSQLTQLTTTKGYDAEGTVCAKDGSIIFTSTRDGDIELYRMDRDGKNVKRLTFEPGYDGGAFFNRDCSKIVWRASRPKPGKELDDFKGLLAKGLVRPSKLELFVMNGDGSDARQVTYLDSASFAPFWVPGEDRIVFSSNYPNPRGREFDIWAINADGTGLEQITFAKGFDGFPMFSPNGEWLAFSSNRATAEGANDTNVFMAKWVKGPAPIDEKSGAQRIKADVTWLADAAREGRGVGTAGLEASGAYIEEAFKALKLEPYGDAAGSYRQKFQVVTGVKAGAATALTIGKDKVAADDFQPLGFSAPTAKVVKGKLVLAGYGLVEPELGFDDYKGIDVKGKIAVVRRFTPEHAALDTPEKQRRAGDLRRKAFVARERGAVALIVVDWPVLAPAPATPPPAPAPAPGAPVDPHAAPAGAPTLPQEARFPALQPEGTTGDAGLPVIIVKRKVLEKLFDKKPAQLSGELVVALDFTKAEAFNVLAKLPAKSATLPPLVIGAHYDHLGSGGINSLAPDRTEPHVGADDNASGVAAVLEIARKLSAQRDALKRDVVFVAFSGEESGVLGSAFLVGAKKELVAPGAAMLNLDMVGRLRGNTLTALGNETADEWKAILESACLKARVRCNMSGDGYGPSDQMSFYTAGVPVLHFFTGAHSDYHKPSDTADKLTYSGLEHVAEVVTEVALAVQDKPLTYQKVAAPAPRGDARSFNASLGTVPDYGGPPPGVKGVLLQDVRPGGGAEQGGMKRGDVIQKLGTHTIGSVEDLMFVLMSSKPGETVRAVVLREGKEVSLEVTFQEGRRR